MSRKRKVSWRSVRVKRKTAELFDRCVAVTVKYGFRADEAPDHVLSTALKLYAKEIDEAVRVKYLMSESVKTTA